MCGGVEGVVGLGIGFAGREDGKGWVGRWWGEGGRVGVL